MKLYSLFIIMFLGITIAFGQTDNSGMVDTTHNIQSTKKITTEIKLSSNPNKYELKKLFEKAKRHKLDLYKLLSVIHRKGSKVITALTDGLFTTDQMQDTIMGADGKKMLTRPFNKAYFLLGLESIDDTSICRIVQRAAVESNDPEIQAMALKYLANQYFNYSKVKKNKPEKSVLTVFMDCLADSDSSATYHQNVGEIAKEGIYNWLEGQEGNSKDISIVNVAGFNKVSLKKLIAQDYQKIVWNNKTGFFEIKR